MRRRLAGIAVLVALPVAGCGGGDDEPGKNAKRFDGEKREVAQVIDDLVAASQLGEPETICDDIFTPTLAEAIASRNQATCSETVEKQLVSEEADMTVTGVKLSGSNALATVREQNKNVTSLSLSKLDGKWRINAIQ